MKKTLVLALSLTVFTSATGMAQDNRMQRDHKSRVTGATAQATAANNDGAPSVLVGTIETTQTSREQVLAYPRLLPQALNCDVTGFDFSITADGKTWGPVSVKGAVFSDEVKDKIKELDPGNIKISINNISVKCNGEEASAKPINLTYNH